MRVAAVNAGSSSLKLSVVEESATLTTLTVDAPEGVFDGDELAGFLSDTGHIDCVAHRVVHGGAHYDSAVLVTPEVRADLADLEALDPLHNPPAMRAIDVVTGQLPSVPAVACFDTSFHQGMPAAASTYAVPRRWRDDWGIRRYGFHGLSHSWCAQRATSLLGDSRRLVTCHLGAGASLAAVLDGRSVDTTMGFTPLEGLVMANRSGTVDPGALLWAQQNHDVDAAEVEHVLNHESGLYGLTGSADLREILEKRVDGDGVSRAAVEVYLHRLVREIGAMVAVGGGIDALAFTGGVGERSAVIRRECVERLAFLGARIDVERNECHTEGDEKLSTEDASVSVVVIEAREDLEMARQCVDVLSDPDR